MPQDVFTATLGYHLRRKREREEGGRLGLAALKLYRLIIVDWQRRLPMRLMRQAAAGQTDVNLKELNESQRQQPETHPLS